MDAPGAPSAWLLSLDLVVKALGMDMEGLGLYVKPLFLVEGDPWKADLDLVLCPVGGRIASSFLDSGRGSS